MALNHTPQFIHASDRSILVKFGHEISEEIHQRVFAFTDFVLNNQIKSVVNIHPAYSSVLFTLDLNADLNETLSLIKKSWEASPQTEIPEVRHVEIPVLYGGEFAEDMDRVSRHTGLNQSEIIQCHEGGSYKVYFTGFSPGFPYIGGGPITEHTAFNHASEAGSRRHSRNCCRTNRNLSPFFAWRLEFDRANTH